MNFKKFISGVSALTIAASAFAAMTITASAAAHAITLTESLSVKGYMEKEFYNFQSADTQAAVEVTSLTGTDVRYRDGYGIFNYGANYRNATVPIAVSAGDIVVVEHYQNQSYDSVVEVNGASADATLTAAAGYDTYAIAADSETLALRISRAEYIPGILIMEADPTVKYSVSVKSSVGDVTFASAEVASGESLTYSFPKYLTDTGNNVIAVSDATSFTASVTPVEDGTITVPYTAYTGTAVAVEPTSNNLMQDNAKWSNGSIYRAFNKNNVASITIPEDGVYTISAYVCSNNTKDTRYLYAKVGEDSVAEFDITKSVNYPELKTDADNEFNAGDVIAFTSSDTNVAVDYILVEKTGELPTPAETTSAGFTFKSTIEKLADQEVTLTITATNGVSEASDTIYITDKIASGNFAGELMLAVIITDVEAGITITSAKINVE